MFKRNVEEKAVEELKHCIFAYFNQKGTMQGTSDGRVQINTALFSAHLISLSSWYGSRVWRQFIGAGVMEGPKITIT